MGCFVVFKRVSIAAVADGAVDGWPSHTACRAPGDVQRKVGPCYEVDGGHVWREATFDAHGLEIAVWWWARMTGERRKLYRAFTTRADAARAIARHYTKTTLTSTQTAALKTVRDAGATGFSNWDGKRRPVDQRTLRLLRARGFVAFATRGPSDCVYVITDTGRAMLA